MTEKKDTFKKVAVLAGGVGEERDISLQSGRTIYNALQKTDLQIVSFDITPDHMSILDDPTIDIFFPILHGRFGEDGRLQAILEQKNLVYTGSGSAASRLAFDKQAAKIKFAEAGIPTPPGFCLKKELDDSGIRNAAQALHTDRYVVKPVSQGSSVGVQILSDPDALPDAARQCAAQYGDCMIETFISGREITVGILDDTPLPVLEIRPKQTFYDFCAKYEDNSTEFLFDTIRDQTLVQTIQRIGLQSHRVLGCRHFSRVDLILTPDGGLFVLEVNTLPGFTSHSLLPMAAGRIGLSPDQLCMKILRAAWKEARAPSESRQKS